MLGQILKPSLLNQRRQGHNCHSTKCHFAKNMFYHISQSTSYFNSKTPCNCDSNWKGIVLVGISFTISRQNFIVSDIDKNHKTCRRRKKPCWKINDKSFATEYTAFVSKLLMQHFFFVLFFIFKLHFLNIFTGKRSPSFPSLADRLHSIKEKDTLLCFVAH